MLALWWLVEQILRLLPLPRAPRNRSMRRACVGEKRARGEKEDTKKIIKEQHAHLKAAQNTHLARGWGGWGGYFEMICVGSVAHLRSSFHHTVESLRTVTAETMAKKVQGHVCGRETGSPKAKLRVVCARERNRGRRVNRVIRLTTHTWSRERRQDATHMRATSAWTAAAFGTYRHRAPNGSRGGCIQACRIFS